MPVPDPGGGGGGGWGHPEEVVSVLKFFFRTLYDIASIYGSCFGWFGGGLGVSMDRTAVMLIVK